MEIKSNRVDGLRVRVYIDEDPMPLDGQGDFLPLVVSVPAPRRGGSPVVEAGGQYAGDFDITRLAWAVDRYAVGNVREEPTARYLHLAYGVTVKLIETAPNGDTWWAVATPQWISAALGGPSDDAQVRADVPAALEQSAQFVRDYNEGDVYCYSVEYEAEWVHNATGHRRTEWEPLAGGDSSLSGMVGYEYAVAEARRALAEAELEAPVEWPRGYPAHPLLWRCVAEPVTLESFVVEAYLGGPDWAYWVVCSAKDAERVDADNVWVAVLACATGSAPGVEPEVALACRDLVTADWSEKPAPLSPEAAEVVFHVAVCGRAHR